MGMATTEKLLGQLRSKLRSEGVHTRTEAKQVMISLLADCMRPEDGFLDGANKAVILVVGVNGVGKTTSIGKLAAMYKADGRSVMLAAATPSAQPQQSSSQFGPNARRFRSLSTARVQIPPPLCLMQLHRSRQRIAIFSSATPPEDCTTKRTL